MGLLSGAIGRFGNGVGLGGFGGNWGGLTGTPPYVPPNDNNTGGGGNVGGGGVGVGGPSVQPTPPYQPQMGGMMPGVGNAGLLAAFSQNPQFQQHLQAIMGGMGPGMSAPIYTPPVGGLVATQPPAEKKKRSLFGG